MTTHLLLSAPFANLFLRQVGTPFPLAESFPALSPLTSSILCPLLSYPLSTPKGRYFWKAEILFPFPPVQPRKRPIVAAESLRVAAE